jgi:molybdate transport system regulatory protein
MVQHSQFSINGSLWISKGNELFIGPAQFRLIKQVINDGSILAASQNLHISYQQAWNIVDKMNRLSPLPLVTRYKGGNDGGGCRIDNFGMKVFHQFEENEERLNKLIDEINLNFNLCSF